MKTLICRLLIFLTLALPALVIADIHVGIGKANITPPVGIPSAGYKERKGEGMQGIHDPLFAIALFIDNGEKKVIFCSVDHLGFTYEMVQKIRQKIQEQPELKDSEIFIGSSHTHSGGGAFLNIPVIGEVLAGPYNPDITQFFYIDKTCDAIFQAYHNKTPAKIGIGYGQVEGLSQYRGSWPKDVSPLTSITVLKVTDLQDHPLAALFNYPVHPTVLKSQNRLFSADFVGYARDHLQSFIGPSVQPLYFNGAQGDINPTIFDEEDRFQSCNILAKSLAKSVKEIWDRTETRNELEITTQKTSYVFQPQATPFGLSLPVDAYQSEMNVIVLNRLHAFITIPGELSCLYDKRLKKVGNELGYMHVSILGLTNDAHGYIILPESWRNKTFESGLSFGGEQYGEITAQRAEELMQSIFEQEK